MLQDPPNIPLSIRPAKRFTWLGFAGILLAFFLCYAPAWNGGILWDDAAHLIGPELASAHGLAAIWTEPGATQQYYPLSYTAFWMLNQCFGHWPLPYHCLNLVLHAGSACLVVLILQELGIPGAFLAGAIFSLHPMEVESVAWMSELKNTLSGACFLGAILCYLRYDRKRCRGLYFAALGLFTAALLAKTVTAMLAPDLAILLWWRHGKLVGRRDLLPLVPFFILGAGLGFYTAWFERAILGAQGAAYALSPADRVLIAGRAFWFYVGKLLWPSPLIFIYPRWTIHAAELLPWLFPCGAAALLALLGFSIRHGGGRGPLAAFLFFAVTLFPALGFVNIYPFRFSFVADHFQYLAGLGLISLFSAGAVSLAQRSAVRLRAAWRAAGAVLLTALGILTLRQSASYADAWTLYRTTLEKNPQCWLAENNLATLAFQKGDLPQAWNHAERAVALNPDDADIEFNLGNLLLAQGQPGEAQAPLQKAVALAPPRKQASIHEALANAYLFGGSVDFAITQFHEAIRLQKDASGECRLGLGVALLQAGRPREAIPVLQAAALRLPDQTAVFSNLAQAYLLAENPRAAVATYERAVAIDPNDVASLDGLAWVRATSIDPESRDGTEAVQRAEAAQTLTHGTDSRTLRVTAAAYAEAGRFDAAMRAAQAALDRLGNDPALTAALQKDLALYREGHPLRMRNEAP